MRRGLFQILWDADTDQFGLVPARGGEVQEIADVVEAHGGWQGMPYDESGDRDWRVGRVIIEVREFTPQQ